MRDHQFTVTLLIGSERQKVVSTTISFRGKFMGWLLTGLDLVMAHKIVFAFRMSQYYLAGRISQFDGVSRIGWEARESRVKGSARGEGFVGGCYGSGPVLNAYRRIR